jgi:hypothetical protein
MQATYETHREWWGRDRSILRRRRDARILWWATVVVAGYGAMALAILCYQIGQHPEAARNPNAYITALLTVPYVVRALIPWFFDAFDRHRDDIAALSTLTIAVFAAVFVAFGSRLARSARIAAEAARDSAIVERKTLAAVARPRIIVRKAELSFLPPPEPPGSVKFEVRNVGGTPAHIMEIKAMLYAGSEGLGALPQLSSAAAPVDEFTLESGGAASAQAVMADEPPGKFEKIRSGALPLCLYGFVRYRDDSAVVREIGFGRVYNAATHHFTPLSDPEYEYGDKAE